MQNTRCNLERSPLIRKLVKCNRKQPATDILQRLRYYNNGRFPSKNPHAEEHQQGASLRGQPHPRHYRKQEMNCNNQCHSCSTWYCLFVDHVNSFAMSILTQLFSLHILSLSSLCKRTLILNYIFTKL